MPGVAGRSGRPQAPIEEKRRRGTLRADRMPTAGALALVEPMPLTMADQSPAAALEKVMARGVVWLAETDAPAVCMLRELLEERGELKAAVDAGLGDRRHLRDIDKQIISLMSQLGFDPAARSRLGLAEVKAVSKLEELRARRESRTP